ncbi:hypothetical protein ACFWPJ_30610, partial [Nocardia sp. NPDC058497]
MVSHLQPEKAGPSDIDSAQADPRRWIAFATTLAAGVMDLLDFTHVHFSGPHNLALIGGQYAQIVLIQP